LTLDLEQVPKVVIIGEAMRHEWDACEESTFTLNKTFILEEKIIFFAFFFICLFLHTLGSISQ